MSFAGLTDKSKRLNEEYSLYIQETEQLPRVNKKQCDHYIRDRCWYEESCKYHHPQTVCQNFQKGLCTNGDHCSEMHPIKPCHQMERNGYCSKGMNCRFGHNIIEYRKEPCEDVISYDGCSNQICSNIHPAVDIPSPENWQTEPCVFGNMCYWYLLSEKKNVDMLGYCGWTH